MQHTGDNGNCDEKPDWHVRFLRMLPRIRRRAARAFRRFRHELRCELIQEVEANTFVAYRQLVQRGMEHKAFASVLARFAIAQVRCGKYVSCRRNRNDVSSHHCRVYKGVTLLRLHEFDKPRGEWREILVEDRRASPADLAAMRIDFPAWLKSLPRRTRRIALLLAAGEATSSVAARFRLTAGRVSQIRRELAESWNLFHGLDHDGRELLAQAG